jgi:peptide/nickel transport system ATP-binding protein
MRAASAPVARVRGLSVEISGQVPQRLAVDSVSFDVHAGETVCIVGESGSGKSMIAHALIGLLPTHGVRLCAGQVFLGDAEITALPEESLRRLRGSAVGMIFQEPMTALNPLMTAGQQIDEVFRAHTSLRPVERAAKAIELLADMQIPDPARAASAYPFQMSGGQRQRVMIAMALALEPRLLIADEPTTALDVTTQAQILALVHRLQQRRGIGVLFITHDFGVVADISDRVLVMQQGRCVEAGPTSKVLGSPAHIYTRKLIAAVPILRTSHAGPTPPPQVKPLLQVDALCKRFVGRGGRTTTALDRVSLSIDSGETVGVVGESGSGKSTLGKMVVGLLQPDSGAVTFDNLNMVGLSRKRLGAARQQIQMVFQDPYASLNPRHRVGDIIAAGPMSAGLGRDAAFDRVERLVRIVGLPSACLSRFPHQFSGGQRQRLSIARALAMQPRLLVADEAVSALDVSVQAQVLTLLREIRQEFGLSMLFITHDLRVASSLCDRIVVMHAGRIVEQGAAWSVCGAPREKYTRELIAAIPGQGSRLGAMAADDVHSTQPSEAHDD